MKKDGNVFQPDLVTLNACYGCGVCAVSCPVQIISMRLSKYGFYRPFIEIDNQCKCTGCGKCETVCSFVFEDVGIAQETYAVQAFSVFTKDNDSRAVSSSGGVAYEIAAKSVREKGLAAVVRYNTEKHVAEHYLAENISELIASRGSKYIQSYAVDAFNEIFKSKSNKKLIVGTPCQIDSFRRLVRKKRCEKDYLLVDFFCHGVPSMNMWKKYISTVEKSIGNISSVHFRDKKHGWHSSWAMNLTGDKDKNWYSLYMKRDLFYTFFLGNKTLNTPCYSCKFRRLNSAADIRIGDLWGQKFKDDFLGVSGVLVMSGKGADCLTQLSITCHIEEESVEVVTEGQMEADLAVPADRPMIMWLLQYRVSLYWIYTLIILPQKAVLKLKRIIKKWL